MSNPASKRILICLFLLSLIYACGETEHRQGEALYQQHCANCHMDHGRGLGALIPPLANSDWLKNNQQELACLIRYGAEEPMVVNDTTYQQAMPGVRELSEFQIANIINYINQAWDNDYGTAKVADLRDQLADCQ